MGSPLLVSALRDQLHRVLKWYQEAPSAFGWGMVLHRRNERGRLRFGVVTPGGESLLLTEALLLDLATSTCWLDGVVQVRLEPRIMRDSLVDALAVHFDEELPREQVEPFKALGGIVTPGSLPSELFILTTTRPGGWPR